VFIGGVTQDSWLADGISWAAANGADVLSNSWGGGLPSTVITNAIRDTTINGRGGLGVLSVFAAGNQNGAVSYPANLPETLAVGALSPCAERKAPTSCDGEFWWGSNFGPTLDLVAPGVNMYTIDLDNAAGYDPWDYYHDFGGTSAAAPLAAGTAALMLTVDPTLTPPELVDLLRSSADDIGAPGFDNQTGFGRLNAYEAMLASDPLRTLTIELKGTGTGIVTSDPGNINCGTICSEIYFKGTVVELTATPIGNAMFTGWSGPADCADGTVTVTTSFECTATFDLPTYQFSVSKAGSGLGTVIAGSQIHCGTTCSSIYTEGTVLELFGYPEPGSQLEGWSGHPDCEDGAVTIMAPMACTATFGPCSGESVLLVPPQVVNGIETFEACNTVQVGAGGFQVGPTGVVTLSAGNSIVLENGFEVLDGGSLSAATGVPISP
jgi:hypothetical protein